MKKALLVGLVTALVGYRGEAGGQEVTLVENGVAKCAVVVAADATKPEKLGAKELVKYIAKATGAAVEIRDSIDRVPEGTAAIAITLNSRLKNPDPELKPEGFKLNVTDRGVGIVGADGRGALYGCYEILKKHFGMRWIAPGEDCEYCVLKGKTVVLPVGKSIHNPYLRIRKTLGGEPQIAWWHARNNMQGEAATRQFFGRDGRLTADGELYEALTVEGETGGGHILGRLLLSGGKPGQKTEERVDEVYAAHPEWFPMIDGERKKTNCAANSPNPCISNPALVDHMAEGLVKLLSGPHACDSYVTIGNNDTTVWCQCDKCRALDPPEKRGTRGELSDRYWYMVNAIARKVWEKLPDAKLGGWAYQNFWYAPVHVKPDPRLRILISYNNQCWRHSVCDRKCPVNVNFSEVYMSWKKLGHPLIVNRDEIGAWDGQGSPGCEMLPSETVLAKNIREYPSIGCSGSSFCVNTPFPEYSSFAKNWSPFYGKRYHWWAMWQTCYISALAMWDPTVDTDAALEEANRLYYGAAWEGGMKRFRALLTDLFLSTPGCIGWGQGTTTGPCLNRPGSEEELVKLLDEAVKAAEAGGDAAVIRHVKREQEIFELTWVKHRKRYVEGYRELTAYRRTDEIKVDGVLDEESWKNQDTYSNFKQVAWRHVPNIQKTYWRVTYDKDTLYMAVEAMEPTPEKIIAGDVVDRFATACANLGNHLELFYSFPDMNEAAWQLMINSKGQIIDSYNRSMTDRDVKIVTKAKWAVKVLKDRWVLEIAIPCSEIGQNIFDGATWKMNVARQRCTKGDTPDKNGDYSLWESSSAANGYFHGTPNFVNVKFAAKRGGTGAKEMTSWKNANLNLVEESAKLHPNLRWKQCKSSVQAKFWGAGANTECEMKLKDGSESDYYVHIDKGEINQYFLPQAKGRVKFSFKARGQGKVGMILLNYVDKTGPNPGGYQALEAPKVQQPYFELTPEWKVYSFVREANGFRSERISTRFFPAGEGSWVDLDDVYANPCE